MKVTEQFKDSRQQSLTMTAISEQHRLNKYFLGVWHSVVSPSARVLIKPTHKVCDCQEA